MSLKMKRTLRTATSEEIAVFDNEMLDEGGEAASIGKVSVHYLDDQIIGTLLIWQEYSEGFNRANPPGSARTMDDLIGEVLTEVSDPLGLPSDYAFEVYFPAISNHQFVSRYEVEEDEEDEALNGYDGQRGS